MSALHGLRGAILPFASVLALVLAFVLAPEIARAETGDDYRFSLARAAISLAGLVAFGWGIIGARGLGGRAARTRLALLGALGVLAFTSYYQFFTRVAPGGFASSDNYHYYVGSKYFDELGYYGLYECSLWALKERGFKSPAPHFEARDLHSMEVVPAYIVRGKGRDCPERLGPERWRSFGDDVSFFSRRWPPHIWQAVWLDHGFHPSPVWTLFGGAIANLAPTSSRSAMSILSRVDRFMILAGLLALYWAFGAEVAALASIAWGTGFLWRYGWVGDAYLRHIWWLSAVLGLCLLRRGRPALGAAMLTLSGSIRVFPAALTLGYGVHAGRQVWRERSLAAPIRRFAIGAAAAAALLIGLVALSSPHGFSAFSEFAEKIGSFAELPATNKMGLADLVAAVFSESAMAAGIVRIALLLVFAPLFWRALAQAEDWEAAALGATLIPMLSNPTNYYFSFIVFYAVLAANRPRIGLVLIATVLAWSLNGLLLYRTYAEFTVAAGIGVVSSFVVVWEMGRPGAGVEDATLCDPATDRAARLAPLTRTPDEAHLDERRSPPRSRPLPHRLLL